MDALSGFLLRFTGPLPYLIVFGILLGCGLGLPIPEDITLFAAGYLCYRDQAVVFPMIGIAFVGVLLGDTIIFVLGRWYGERLTTKWPFKRVLTPSRIDSVGEKLRVHGYKLVFAARFMPGLRAPIYFTAGTLRLPYRVFLTYDGFAAVISVPAIIYAVYHFGAQVDRVIHVIKRIEGGIVTAILSILLLLVLKHYWSKNRANKARVEHVEET
ncbi:DedA family protein [Planctomycetota bacterium]